jgi:hypothetical protein
MIDHPVLSVAIPTRNRRELLRHSLARHLVEFAKWPFSWEVVISDNNSDDATTEMVAEVASRFQQVRYFRRNQSDPLGNYLNVMRKCRGEFVVYLADDDHILAEPLGTLVARARDDRSLAGIYCDWAAYDQVADTELHRYFPPGSAARFEPHDVQRFVNHVLSRRILPEIGIWRRRMMVDAFGRTAIQYPYLTMAYSLLRQGAIEISDCVFYRESRVLPPEFAGRVTENSRLSLTMVGEPLRLAIENMTCRAMLDAGSSALAADSITALRTLIEGWVQSRIGLEVARAVARRDWIAAVELQRKLVLWHGAGVREAQVQAAQALTVPAAIQAIEHLRSSLSGIDTVALLVPDCHALAVFYERLFPGQAVTVDSPDGLHPSSTLLVCGADAAFRVTAGHYAEFPGHVVIAAKYLEQFRLGVSPESLG